MHSKLYNDVAVPVCLCSRRLPQMKALTKNFDLSQLHSFSNYMQTNRTFTINSSNDAQGFQLMIIDKGMISVNNNAMRHLAIVEKCILI